MRKIRIGVLGAYRGTSMINYCKRADHAEVVAICDKSHEALDAQRQYTNGLNITFYDHFDDFIKHDMDAVVLANYANEHAPFAIRCCWNRLGCPIALKSQATEKVIRPFSKAKRTSYLSA